MLSGKSQSQKVKYVPSVLFTQLCPTLRPHGLWPRQAPLFTGFFRQEYWSGLPCPPPGDLSNPGIEPRSPALQADSRMVVFLKSYFTYWMKQIIFNTDRFLDFI